MPPISSERATCWSVTILMKTVSKETAEECINRARQQGWTVDGQLEKGEGGTEHYQLMVKTPQIRFSAVKKMFPTAHIEVARNPAALEKYVHKEDTREGELPKQDSSYLSVNQLWLKMFDWTHKENPEEYAAMKIADYRKMNKDSRLEELDYYASFLIKKGYFIEHLIVNPQVRSSFAKFAPEIVHRSVKIIADRQQTDRQEESSSVTINIPTTDGRDSEDSSTDGQEDASQDGSEASEDSGSCSPSSDESDSTCDE